MSHPIFTPDLTGEPEQLCAELSSTLHTFGRLEVSMRLIVLIIPKGEPRAPHRPAVPHPSSYRPDGMSSVVYPGMYTRAYTPGYYTHQGTGHIHRVSLLLPYHPGYPSCSHTTLGIYLPWCTYSRYIPTMVHIQQVYSSPVVPQGVLLPPLYLRVYYTYRCTYSRVYYTHRCTYRRMYLSQQGYP